MAGIVNKICLISDQLEFHEFKREIKDWTFNNLTKF